MKIEDRPETAPAFPQIVTAAVSKLKDRLQQDYERTYPRLGEIIRIVLDEEEANAWELSFFPHLLLPDLVEAHIATLGLQPPDRRHDDILETAHFTEFEGHSVSRADVADLLTSGETLIAFFLSK